jgi:hypothetical protein
VVAGVRTASAGQSVTTRVAASCSGSAQRASPHWGPKSSRVLQAHRCHRRSDPLDRRDDAKQLVANSASGEFPTPHFEAQDCVSDAHKGVANSELIPWVSQSERIGPPRCGIAPFVVRAVPARRNGSCRPNVGRQAVSTLQCAQKLIDAGAESISPVEAVRP